MAYWACGSLGEQDAGGEVKICRRAVREAVESGGSRHHVGRSAARLVTRKHLGSEFAWKRHGPGFFVAGMGPALSAVACRCSSGRVEVPEAPASLGILDFGLLPVEELHAWPTFGVRGFRVWFMSIVGVGDLGHWGTRGVSGARFRYV